MVLNPYPIIVQTEAGFEPAFWSHEFACYCVEPGFALTTREEAQSRLDNDVEALRASNTATRTYAGAMAHACGYHD